MVRKSLSRTGAAGYREYLGTRAWHWRRQRFFRDIRRSGAEPACQVCQVTLAAAGTLDVHHVSYDGVVQKPDGSWVAREADGDLMPLCREHHEAVHAMLDRKKDFWGWDRRKATLTIIAHLFNRYWGPRR